MLDDLPAEEAMLETADGRREKSMTIGAVTKALKQEFPDISISKIRYLEDQKLLAPRRTPGGYRLYSQTDVARLRTILRLQRDEFLPLRVIRQELASRPRRGGRGRRSRRRRRPARGGRAPAPERLGARRRRLVLARGRARGDARRPGARQASSRSTASSRASSAPGVKYFDETEREIIRAVTELARYGVGGRNLRVFRTSADREAQLLQTILAPALRSRNPERRKEAIEALENLAAVATHLKHLLLIRDLRKVVG